MNQLAVSLAGHDKDSVYAVVAEEGSMVLLADGRTRTLEKPKKKNQKHIRRIGNLPNEVREKLQRVSQNSDLVHVLKLYQDLQKEKR
jgi:hypothetical protein